MCVEVVVVPVTMDVDSDLGWWTAVSGGCDIWPRLMDVFRTGTSETCGNSAGERALVETLNEELSDQALFCSGLSGTVGPGAVVGTFITLLIADMTAL